MAADSLNLTIEQGITFTQKIEWRYSDDTPIDVTGYTARLHIRNTKASTTILIDLTTENDGIVLGGTAGSIDLKITAVITSAINWAKGVYDLEIVSSSGEVTRLVEGVVNVSFEVTR